MRLAARTDASQQAIVDALRKAGCYVRVIGRPVDLLVGKRDGRLIRWQPIECKTPGCTRLRRDQEMQNMFVDQWNIPRVSTPEQALIAMGLMR